MPIRVDAWLIRGSTILSMATNMFKSIGDMLDGVGDWAGFAARTIVGSLSSQCKRQEIVRNCIEIGVGSLGVVAITGGFIGMVLAVQTYASFNRLGLATSLGAMIHKSTVRELGPVLAAVMLAGRVGTAMAAKLGTMRVTDQLDAMACLGVDPVKYLSSPRFVASILMIPLLTVIADLMGIVGSSFICLKVFHIESFHYWQHTTDFVQVWDLLVGIVKAFVYGGVMALICCHRGFHCGSGAEGVGRAATQGFVLSFVAIIVLDFLIAMLANGIEQSLWPGQGGRVI